MKKVFVILAALVAAVAPVFASQPREVRAAWLVPSADARVSADAVRRVAQARFNTVLVRMQTPSGVWWKSALAPSTVTASMADADVPAAMLDAARSARMAVHAVVIPDASDADSLAEVYREMQLRYGFDGVVIDTSRMMKLSSGERRDIIDRLTLALIEEFPELATSVSVVPDRSGDIAREASELLSDGLVDAVYLQDVTNIPPRLLAGQWGAVDGVTVTYRPDRGEESRFQESPWGIAYVAPDESMCRSLAAGLFAGYAHLPQNEARPTMPDAPADVEQEFTGSSYRIRWSVPAWTDSEAPVSYYSVYLSDGRVTVMPKTTVRELVFPSDDPHLRFSVTAWDVNNGESDPVIARSVDTGGVGSVLTSPDAAPGISVICDGRSLSLRSQSVLGTVDLYDIQGSLVRSRRINRHSATIDCSDLGAGVYIVAMRDSRGEAISQKILLK